MAVVTETEKEKAERLTVRTELHEKLVKWFRDAKHASQTARERSEKDRDYYDSIQYTAEEIATLTLRGQAAEPFNRIAPKVDLLLGAERQQRTQPKAMPRNPADQSAADAATEALRYVLLNNDFDQVRSNVNENLLVEGSGYGEVRAVPGADGDIEVSVSEIPWDRFFSDPYSRRKDSEDARYRGQVIWFDRDEARREWPGNDALLDDAWQEGRNDDDTYGDKPNVWVDTDRNRLAVVEMWYRESGQIFRCVFTRGGILEGPDRTPYSDEDGVPEDPYVCATAKINRQGERYGVVRPLIPIQDEINKRRSKALHLLSVRQFVYENGALADPNETKRQLARPDGGVEVQTAGLRFELLNTNDMAQAQFELLQEAKSEIDTVGANAALQGKGPADASGRALQIRQQSGQMELGPIFDALRSWQMRAYRKVWNRIHQFWTAERAVRVTDNPESPKWIVLNRPVTVGEELAAQFGGQLPPEYANDPRMLEVARVENDLAKLDVDIILGDAPDYATLKQEQFATLAELAKAGVQERMMIALLKLSGVPEVDEVVKLLQGTPEEQEARAKQAEEQMRIQVEDAISKIVERNAKAGKAQADAEQSAAHADLYQAQAIEVLSGRRSDNRSAVAG